MELQIKCPKLLIKSSTFLWEYGISIQIHNSKITNKL